MNATVGPFTPIGTIYNDSTERDQSNSTIEKVKTLVPFVIGAPTAAGAVTFIIFMAKNIPTQEIDTLLMGTTVILGAIGFAGCVYSLNRCFCNIKWY